jgi:hypothetical protein
MKLILCQSYGRVILGKTTLRKILQEALALDVKKANQNRNGWLYAEKACAACVLTSDAPNGKDELNRVAALEFVRARLHFPEQLDEDDRFSHSAKLSVAPLDEIDRELRRSARSTLTVFLPDRSTPAAMQDWPLAAQFLQWTMRGHRVRLAVAPVQMSRLSEAEKLAIRDFALLHNVDLVAADAPIFGNGACVLAMVASDSDSSHFWASREAEPRLPGPAWGRPSSRPMARGRASTTPQVAAVDLHALLPPPEAQFVQIGSELDCDLASFGVRAAKVMIQLLSKCRSWPRAGIEKASYQDPYVSSPLIARLLVDTIGHLFAESGVRDAMLTVETRLPRSNEQHSEPWHIAHDWREASDQEAVLEQLGKRRGVRVYVLYKDVPHGRYLNINFRDGSRATIVLDQGFGAWAPPRHVSVRYNFVTDTTTQSKSLATINAALQRRGVGKTYFVATVRSR